MSDTLNREDVAKMLFVNPEKVSELIQKDGLPAVKLGKGYVFIKQKVLDWLWEKTKTEMGSSKQSTKQSHGYPELPEL